MTDRRRNVDTLTLGELARLPARRLAELALQFDEESAALWTEHQDPAGDVPADVERLARRLSLMSEFVGRLADL